MVQTDRKEGKRMKLGFDKKKQRLPQEVEGKTIFESPEEELKGQDRQPMISICDLHKAYGEKKVLKGLNLEVYPGELFGFIGKNGIGKSTFLKSILGLIPSISGSVEQGDYLYIGYFEQEMAPGNNNTCIEEIWKEYPSYTQYQVRSALAKCGLTTKNIESLVRVLSGGEQAKLRLCKLMNRETNILLLDEPTNH